MWQWPVSEYLPTNGWRWRPRDGNFWVILSSQELSQWANLTGCLCQPIRSSLTTVDMNYNYEVSDPGLCEPWRPAQQLQRPDLGPPLQRYNQIGLGCIKRQFFWANNRFNYYRVPLMGANSPFVEYSKKINLGRFVFSFLFLVYPTFH